jgi:phospholipid/cholesterol/gamma-HCH transport system substrate-binding protein
MMAQRKQLSWTELRVGVFVLFGLAIMALAIFYVTGGGTFSPKYRLTTYLPEVEGLQVGAPVSLSGLQVGNVESIALNKNSADRQHNIAITMRIEKKFQENIRTDSSASLVTQGLLGDRYVSITRGITGTALQNGSTVPSQEEKAIQQIVARGIELEENLGALANDVSEIVADVKKGRGTLGKLLVDNQLYDHLNASAAKIDAMAGDLRAGQGSLGKMLTDDELYQKANSAIGHADDVLGAVKDQQGSLGKFVYDPAVYDSAHKFLDNGNAVLSDVRAGKGTLGKLATDDVLFTNLRDASANVRDATAKMNSNQGTVGKIFTDPQLYDNLTGLTGDMRGLVADFKKDPKKFLHVKFSIF